jgi:hypothetical protein
MKKFILIIICLFILLSLVNLGINPNQAQAAIPPEESQVPTAAEVNEILAKHQIEMAPEIHDSIMSAIANGTIQSTDELNLMLSQRLSASGVPQEKIDAVKADINQQSGQSYGSLIADSTRTVVEALSGKSIYDMTQNDWENVLDNTDERIEGELNNMTVAELDSIIQATSGKSILGGVGGSQEITVRGVEDAFGDWPLYKEDRDNIQRILDEAKARGSSDEELQYMLEEYVDAQPMFPEDKQKTKENLASLVHNRGKYQRINQVLYGVGIDPGRLTVRDLKQISENPEEFLKENVTIGGVLYALQGAKIDPQQFPAFANLVDTMYLSGVPLNQITLEHIENPEQLEELAKEEITIGEARAILNNAGLGDVLGNTPLAGINQNLTYNDVDRFVEDLENGNVSLNEINNMLGNLGLGQTQPYNEENPGPGYAVVENIIGTAGATNIGPTLEKYGVDTSQGSGKQLRQDLESFAKNPALIAMSEEAIEAEVGKIFAKNGYTCPLTGKKISDNTNPLNISTCQAAISIPGSCCTEIADKLKKMASSLASTVGKVLPEFMEAYKNKAAANETPEVCKNSSLYNPLHKIVCQPGTKSVAGMIMNLVGHFLGILYNIAASLAVIFIIIGGIRYMIASGNEQMVTAAKKNIIYAAIGVAIILGTASFLKTLAIGMGANPNAFFGETGVFAAVPGIMEEGTLTGVLAGEEIVQNILNLLLSLLTILGIIGMVLGGIWYMTSGGNEDRMELGRKTLIYSIIGLALAIGSMIIVKQVAQLFSANSSPSTLTASPNTSTSSTTTPTTSTTTTPAASLPSIPPTSTGTSTSSTAPTSTSTLPSTDPGSSTSPTLAPSEPTDPTGTLVVNPSPLILKERGETTKITISYLPGSDPIVKKKLKTL